MSRSGFKNKARIRLQTAHPAKPKNWTLLLEIFVRSHGARIKEGITNKRVKKTSRTLLKLIRSVFPQGSIEGNHLKAKGMEKNPKHPKQWLFLWLHHQVESSDLSHFGLQNLEEYGIQNSHRMIGWPAIPTGKANWRFAKAPAIGSFASWIKDGCIILLEAIFHNVEKGPTPSSAQQRSPIWKEQWHGSLLAILSNTASVQAWELLLRFYRVDVKGKIIYQISGSIEWIEHRANLRGSVEDS